MKNWDFARGRGSFCSAGGGATEREDNNELVKHGWRAAVNSVAAPPPTPSPSPSGTYRLRNWQKEEDICCLPPTSHPLHMNSVGGSPPRLDDSSL